LNGEDATLRTLKIGLTPVQVEILNGVERRRRWSEDEKARIIEESFTPGTKVSDVARKHGVSRGLIFAWRKEARVDKHAYPAVPRLIPVQRS
jgi:transposase